MYLRFVLVGVVFCAISTTYAYQPLTFYNIDATDRGTSVVNMVTTLSGPGYSIQNQSEVALQTTLPANLPYAPLIKNGFIPFVQSVTASTYDTLLIVSYLPSGSSKQTQYIVVPIEQVVSVIYSPTPIVAPNPVVISTFSNSVLPLLTVDPAKRAADIQNVFTTLSTTAPYLLTNQSQVWIKTTLTGSPPVRGPYYPPIQNGIIPNVQSISFVTPGDTLMIITYQSQGSNFYVTGTIVVAAEQVQQIVYFPTNPGNVSF